MTPDYLECDALPYVLDLMGEYDDLHAHRALRCKLIVTRTGVQFVNEYGAIVEPFDSFSELLAWLNEQLGKW